MSSLEEDLEKYKSIYLLYLQMKIEQQDWHGVADAAMDLRDLEVEINIRKEKSKDLQ